MIGRAIDTEDVICEGCRRAMEEHRRTGNSFLHVTTISSTHLHIYFYIIFGLTNKYKYINIYIYIYTNKYIIFGLTKGLLFNA